MASRMADTQAPARILAIEPDSQSAAVVYRILHNRVSADVVVVPGVDAALSEIAAHVPDLILTSTFLPPADLGRLIDDLRVRDGAAHTQVIATPHSLDAPGSDPFDRESVRVLPFPRKGTAGGLHCDPVVLRKHVEQYLEQALMLRLAGRPGQQQGLSSITSLAPAGRGLDPCQPGRVVAATATDVRALASLLRPADRRRASRRRAADLAAQLGVRINQDSDATIVDISCTGVRVETSTILNPGSLVSLELIGMERSLTVGARLIRSEAVETGGSDVKYRAAAMFLNEIDLFAPNGNPIVVATDAGESRPPTVLAELLGRVLANANWASNGVGLWSLFEAELEALVRAREVRIRAVPVRTTGGCQSLYFGIPSVTRARHGLHVVFERGYRPTAAEFRLLKAAASMAAVVLDLAPGGETP